MDLRRQRLAEAARERRRSRLASDHPYDAETWVALLGEVLAGTEDVAAQTAVAEEMTAVGLGNALALALGASRFELVTAEGTCSVGAHRMPPWLVCRAVLASLLCRGSMAFTSLAEHRAIASASDPRQAVDALLVEAMLGAATGDEARRGSALDGLQRIFGEDRREAERFVFDEPEPSVEGRRRAAAALIAFVANLAIVDAEMPAAHASGFPPIDHPILLRALRQIRRNFHHGPERPPGADHPRAIVRPPPLGVGSVEELTAFLVRHRLLPASGGGLAGRGRQTLSSPDHLVRVELELVAPGPGVRPIVPAGVEPPAAVGAALAAGSPGAASGEVASPAPAGAPLVPRPETLPSVDRDAMVINGRIMLFGDGASDLVTALHGARPTGDGVFVYTVLELPIRGWSTRLHLYGMDVDVERARAFAPAVDVLLLVSAKGRAMPQHNRVAAQRGSETLLGTVGAIEQTMRDRGLPLRFALTYDLEQPRALLKPILAELLGRLRR